MEESTTVGAATLLSDINDYLKGGLLSLGAIAIGVMAIVLLLLFKVRWRLLPLGVIVIGVTWALRPGRVPGHPACPSSPSPGCR